jgi:ferredoxin-NADP reductase
MPTTAHTAPCTAKRLIAPQTYELRLEKPRHFTFTPGQFVLFEIPRLNGEGVTPMRAYSIASAPCENELLFVIKLVQGGRASTWIERQVNIGMAISFRGPCGVFILDRKTPHPYFFVATGAGIAPFRSQLLWALGEQSDMRPMDLLFGAHSARDLFWEEELMALAEAHDNLTVHFSLLEDGQSIQATLPSLIPKNGAISIYICGAPETVKEVKEMCLRELRIPKENVHVEAYI